MSGWKAKTKEMCPFSELVICLTILTSINNKKGGPLAIGRRGGTRSFLFPSHLGTEQVRNMGLRSDGQ